MRHSCETATAKKKLKAPKVSINTKSVRLECLKTVHNISNTRRYLDCLSDEITTSYPSNFNKLDSVTKVGVYLSSLAKLFPI